MSSIAEQIVQGDVRALARAATWIENGAPEAAPLLQELSAHLGKALVVGITGPPGAGKSTLCDQLIRLIRAARQRVAVLAVDPSSQRTGGSVLGDKTRMPRLATDERAFIRASPSAGTLGGVARATSQAMLVLEAAAYDVVLVETVGVGQSETTVAGMVDTFLFLTLARTGDQLQGIKRGILELADVIAVNKADDVGGVDREAEARSAARELGGALRMVRGREGAPSVVTCSGLTGAGVDDVWQEVLDHRARLGDEGLTEKRAHQQLDFAWALVRDELEQRLRRSEPVRRVGGEVRDLVLRGELPAVAAADRILAAYDDAEPGAEVD